MLMEITKRNVTFLKVKVIKLRIFIKLTKSMAGVYIKKVKIFDGKL